MNFDHSAKALDYMKRVQAFMDEFVFPAEAGYHEYLAKAENPWTEPPVMAELKAEAKRQGLWNMFFPDEKYGVGLSNVEYAPIAEITGHSFIAPEVFNCNAPDTGNMEVLIHYGSEQQKETWLQPLLEGKIRSAFGMTEPDVASSDATNMEGTAVIDGDDVVINGKKWWTTGIGHPSCKFIIFMGLTYPDAPRHARHSMVIVPKDTAGVEVKRMLPVFGKYDEPYGHGEVHFNNVRVPASHIIAGPGRGFEIAQGRLGPGRIHHCMRAIGAAEKGLRLLCERATSRVAFGKPIAKLGGNFDKIADARMSIEQARLLTLKAAHIIDTKGVFSAMSEISQIKVIAPNVAQTIIDQAIQIHGGAGVSDETGLTDLFGYARVLRLADGPDEVHRAMIAKIELKKYLKS